MRVHEFGQDSERPVEACYQVCAIGIELLAGALNPHMTAQPYEYEPGTLRARGLMDFNSAPNALANVSSALLCTSVTPRLLRESGLGGADMVFEDAPSSDDESMSMSPSSFRDSSTTDSTIL